MVPWNAEPSIAVVVVDRDAQAAERDAALARERGDLRDVRVHHAGGEERERKPRKVGAVEVRPLVREEPPCRSGGAVPDERLLLHALQGARVDPDSDPALRRRRGPAEPRGGRVAQLACERLGRRLDGRHGKPAFLRCCALRVLL